MPDFDPNVAASIAAENTFQASQERPAASALVFDLAEIEEGDFVAYPGLVRPGRGRQPYTPSVEERDPRDWLEVRRLEGGHIIGVRVNPKDWEVEDEYHVYPMQLSDNGVQLVKLGG